LLFVEIINNREGIKSFLTKLFLKRAALKVLNFANKKIYTAYQWIFKEDRKSKGSISFAFCTL